MRFIRCIAGAFLCLLALAPLPLAAQGTLHDYQRAGRVLDSLSTLAVNVAEPPTWIGPGRFWYRKSVKGGNEFVLVDAATGAKRAPFDHARLASALSSAAETTYTAVTLPFREFSFAARDSAIELDARGAHWRCNLEAYQCTRVGPARAPGAGGPFGRGRPVGFRLAGAPEQPPTPSTACVPPGWGPSRSTADTAAGGARVATRVVGVAAAVTSCVSPDGRLEAFIQNYNVAVRPSGAGRPRPPRAGSGYGRIAPAPAPDFTMLSYDGSEGDAYQLMSIRWSPDSKRLVAYRVRPGYRRMVHYVLSSPANQLQPRDTAIFYQKPGDVLDFVQPVLIDVEKATATPIENTLFPSPYQISQAVWRKDGHAFTFEYNQRGHQVYRVIEVNAATGQARTLIDEQSPTFISYRPAGNAADNGSYWRFDVDDGREILWLSERDGWKHLYLYDGLTGRVKNQITKGPWVVRGVDSVDVARRQIYFRASGMIPGQDPYFVHYYRINFDGTGLVKYTEADGNHALYWSPDGAYFVDVYSRVDLPTVMELRRASDMRLTPLEQGDMTAMLATGLRPPEVFKARGRDGKTDIWGIIVRPTNFDPSRKYPVVEQIYAGPQGNFVPKSWGGGLSLQPMAELGFILVQIDGMGTNNRSRAFHDVAWKNLGDAGFPDHILWHRAVAAKYPWYDLTRVGLYGTSAGGQNAMGGLLFHPEFYKVAYANSGCHDNRMDKIWWNEQWMGWPLGPQYEASSNVVNAGKLQGHLMLVIGEFDTNVDPSSGYQVVNALIQAGKVFDLLVVPNGGHGAGGDYAIRKRNDFFVQWLLGVTPPDWNAGAATDVERAIGLGFPSEPDMAPSFYDGPDDPPYVWW